ncbi:c-type cytochrome [Tahibacter amnicola]|uniref:Cytochrome c4 n=1 Tax=Tahibacter amnicola TaxID=2976241 RepID=A0ABY6BA30_9GAMM|nr:cytochrome c4 [Tahibacter amnicola]UXI66519.1 cytochrome c4 [Tahibacter amnicola]
MRMPVHRVFRWPMGLLLMVSATACVADDFLDLRAVKPVQGDAARGETLAATCGACHGPGGNAVIPTFPKLAGQKVGYLYWKLVQFKREGRQESPMTALVSPLSDADMRDLAAYFASSKSVAPTAAPKPSTGATLFRDGAAERGIPPCQACHGDHGEGIDIAGEPQYAVYPRLQGQQPAYLTQRLTEFRDGKRRFTSSEQVMSGVARSLSDEDIRAVSDWLPYAQ